MRSRTIQTALTILLLASGFISAAESPTQGKLELKLDDCIKIAMQKNPLMRASAGEITVAQETVAEARAPYYPEFKAVAGYSKWQTRAFLPEGLLPPTAPKVIGPTDDYKAQGVARWMIFDGGERGARLTASKAMAAVSEANFDTRWQDILLKVQQSFYLLSASFELRNVATQNLARAEQHLKLANDRKSAGASPESDVLRARVAASEARLELVRSENLVRINMGSLNTVMGLPVETSLGLVFEKVDSRITSDGNTSSALSQAIICRPEVRAAQKRIEAARASLSMAKSEYGPKVRAEGSYGLRDDSSSLEEKEYAAGISVELPIFSGFSTKHKIAEKRAELAKVEAEAESIIQGIQQEVWIAKSRLRESEETVQAADSRVKDARESTRMAEERYKVGSSTITDLMDTQTALARAEAGLVEANWTLKVAQASLARSIGAQPAEQNK